MPDLFVYLNRTLLFMGKDLPISRNKKTVAVKPLRAAKNTATTNHKRSAVPSKKESKASPGEIDDIFSAIKSKKCNEVESDSVVRAKAQKKSKSDRNSNAEPPKKSQISHGVIMSERAKIISPDPPVERIDSETGLKVYKAHLLKVGEGGGTPLCPFDCDCCF